MQNLRCPLLRTQIHESFSLFKTGVGQIIAILALPTANYSTFTISAFLLRSASFFHRALKAKVTPVSRDPLPVFSAGGPCEQFWHRQECPLFDPVHRPNTASTTPHGALKESFREAAVACDMPESCKFPSPDSCQKRFLWTHKGADLAPHPVVGLVL